MDSSKDLVSAILQQGPSAYRKSQEGLQSSYLSGEGKLAFDFVCDYYQTYGALPPTDIILAKTGVALDTSTKVADVGYYITEIVDGHLQVQLKEHLDASTKLLAQWKPKEAFAQLEDSLRKIRSSQIVGSKVVPISSLAKAVWARYELIESGATGILTPWPLMNQATLGFWPQDLILFVARVGIGKTWTQAQLALKAWNDGHRVLFATTEMKPERIAQRIYALKMGINYTEFTHGKLGAFARESVKAQLMEAAQGLTEDLLHVVGGDFDFQIGNFEAAIDQVQPKLVLLDGAYLLRVAGANRIERAANAFDELKRLANRMSVPIVVTMQFNREVKANQANTVKTESIALTDVASWNADLIYGLIQTEDMKAEKKVIFKNLKAREGVGEDFECNWDLDIMNFKQIGKLMKNGVGGGDADEGGGGGYSSGNNEAPF